MNLIQQQANSFFRIHNQFRRLDSYKPFIQKVRDELNEYKKTVFKIQFLERLVLLTNGAYADHLPKCSMKKTPDECPENQYYEHILFFLKQEIEALDKTLGPEEMHLSDKQRFNDAIDRILADLNEIKLGQQVTYDDFRAELEELKSLYVLNKKNLRQVLTGKLTEMVAGGVISETISKEVVGLIQGTYKGLLS